MLEVRDLTAGYDGPNVVEGVSFDVRAGEFVGLLGSNNAGKSTVINCLSGLVRPRAGRVRLDGEDLSTVGAHDIVARGLVQVPEGRLVFPRMSVLDNLMLGGIGRGARPHRAGRLEEVFALFPRLKERARQWAGTLSGGEQQMLAIGRGLMAGPRLLMLDEPSLGLSPLFVQTIFRALRRLHEGGLTILVVEQNLKLTLANASRGIVLEQGRVVLEGAGADLEHDPRTRRAYLGL